VLLSLRGYNSRKVLICQGGFKVRSEKGKGRREKGEGKREKG
jgi:hypothetical protein